MAARTAPTARERMRQAHKDMAYNSSGDPALDATLAGEETRKNAFNKLMSPYASATYPKADSARADSVKAATKKKPKGLKQRFQEAIDYFKSGF